MPHLTTLSAAFAEWFQANKVQKQPNGSHVQAQSTGPGHIPGEKGFLRLFWTGDSLSLLPGNLCRLFALASWWLIFHSAGPIWICAAVGVGTELGR